MQERIKGVQPKAIVLSGGPNSVHVADAPQPPPGFFEYVREQGIPVLGVCYGMQLMVHVSRLFSSPTPSALRPLHASAARPLNRQHRRHGALVGMREQPGDDVGSCSMLKPGA